MTEAAADQDQTLASAMGNAAGIERDMAELGTLVREKFFNMIVHDLKDNSDDVLTTDGKLCNACIDYFLKVSNRGKITNSCIRNASERDFKQYLRFMWNQGLTTKGKGNIRRELSQEKSAVYAAINEAFKSKFVFKTSPLYPPVELTNWLLHGRIGAYLCCGGSAFPCI
jgi:hypothetical protein